MISVDFSNNAPATETSSYLTNNCSIYLYNLISTQYDSILLSDSTQTPKPSQ